MQLVFNIERRTTVLIVLCALLLGSVLLVSAFNSGGPPSFVGHSSEEGAVPPGAVLYFNLTACPNGYTEMTNISGMYVVAGNSTTSPLGSMVGTRLSIAENRATGAHAVTINDPGHSHTVSVHNPTGVVSPAGAACGPEGSVFCADGGGFGAQTAFTGITASAGTVAGTNAPYVQLLACVKN